jgi:hypothetical protein
MRSLHQFGVMIAAICHDIDHPGNNNGHEIEKESDIAQVGGGAGGAGGCG